MRSTPVLVGTLTKERKSQRAEVQLTFDLDNPDVFELHLAYDSFRTWTIPFEFLDAAIRQGEGTDIYTFVLTACKESFVIQLMHSDVSSMDINVPLQPIKDFVTNVRADLTPFPEWP